MRLIPGYPSDILCEIGYGGLTGLNPLEKRPAGIPKYKRTCFGISLDRSHVELSRDIPSVFVKFRDIPG